MLKGEGPPLSIWNVIGFNILMDSRKITPRYAIE